MAMQTAVATSARESVQIIDCGLSPYGQVLDRQRRVHEEIVRKETSDTILIAEHHPVVTLGARKAANRLLLSEADLARKQIELIETTRGGGATAHNPGQIVFYPILDLRRLGLDINQYIRTLERIGVELLTRLGLVPTMRKNLPGLWIDNRKIASIGVRVSRSVTYHGMAINIRNDLSIFDAFVPCGLEGVEMTSVLKETGRRYSMTKVKQILTDLLIKHLRPIHEAKKQHRKLPAWLRRPLPAGGPFQNTESVLKSLGIETICDGANCPNRGMCRERGTATVLILGKTCTRNCRFCSVISGKPAPPDPGEPERIAEMARQLNLKYLVITSVTRDDLGDGGAGHFRDCINHVRQNCGDIRFEILTPDFKGCQSRALETLADALGFVFGHNVETVPSLYPVARPGADYHASLNLLRAAKQILGDIDTKSSIMLGLGETDAEVEQTLLDLRGAGCDRITIGQYLRPAKDRLDVTEYIRPEKFGYWKRKARELGFSWVCSEPFARTSYLADLPGAGENVDLRFGDFTP